MLKENSFFAGLEEIIARLLGAIITLAFFLIYIVAVNQITLDWVQTFVLLTIFWLTYEVVSLILFSVFSFFAKAKNSSLNQGETQIENEYDPASEDTN